MSEEVGYEELYSKKYKAKQKLRKFGKWLAPRAKKAGAVMGRGTKIIAKGTARGIVKVAKSPKTKKVFKGIGQAMVTPPPKKGKRREPGMFDFGEQPLNPPSFDMDFKAPEVDLPSGDFFFGSPKQRRKIHRHRRRAKKQRHRKRRYSRRGRRKIEIYI